MLTAIPWGFAAIRDGAHLKDIRTSAWSGRWHIARSCAAWSALGLVLSVVLAGQNGVLAMVGLTIGTMGILSTLPLFWSLPTAFLAGTGAAAGIALINSIGNLAGFVSPYAVGWLKDQTSSTDAGMYLLAASLVDRWAVDACSSGATGESSSSQALDRRHRRCR